MTLRVNGSGHILHAYVNGQYLGKKLRIVSVFFFWSLVSLTIDFYEKYYVGSQWATYGIFNYVFEKQVKLNPGRNHISLLSATIGLQVYIFIFV